MIIEQIYTNCLAHGAYYIECDGEAAVIDPLREPAPYLQRATRDGARIRYVLETHFHADFVSGHVDLAQATGATIVYGPTAAPAFPAHVATDGEELPLGSAFIRVLHTPGHTMESCCYLLLDANRNAVALFSGDTLFIGDVGRPDLAQKVKAELTQELLAGLLYDSLRNKLMPLPDDLIVYPGHGAGSACGKNMSKETTDTLGHQKATNYALRPELSREAFIQEVLTGLTTPPGYFPANVLRNISGSEPVSAVLERGRKALDPDAFLEAVEAGALIVDIRDAETFAKGFVPGSINIGISGSFAPWAGALIPDLRTPLVLVAPADRLEEALTRLARVGLDNVIGHLAGGFEAWKAAARPVDSITRISADQLANLALVGEPLQLIDVRRRSEWESEHVEGAMNAPLDHFDRSLQQIDAGRRAFILCAGGYRSMIFCSLLKRAGVSNIVDVRGGFAAVKESGRLPVSEYVCPTTLL